ncbi:hypothetical protein CHUAL_007899 [Chamberlinius hualienensis]
MNTRLESDPNGNSSEDSENNSIIYGINQLHNHQSQNKSYSTQEVNYLFNNVLDQLTDLEEIMMDNAVDGSSKFDEGELPIQSEDLEIDEDEYEEDDDATLAGYRFCAEETIRFLIHEEKFSPDDPIILELQSHLDQQQKILQDKLRKQQQQTSETQVDVYNQSHLKTNDK